MTWSNYGYVQYLALAHRTGRRALLVFGTKKLRNLGGDLGGAVKGFKQAVQEGQHQDQG